MVNCIVLGGIAMLFAQVWAKEINMLGVSSSNEYLSGAVHNNNMDMKLVKLPSDLMSSPFKEKANNSQFRQPGRGSRMRDF